MAGHIRTVPLEPLEEFLQADNHCHFARIIGVHKNQYYAWKKAGIPIFNADRIAVKTLGVHPGVIWLNHWFKEDI